jgi:hypothetical protein
MKYYKKAFRVQLLSCLENEEENTIKKDNGGS